MKKVFFYACALLFFTTVLQAQKPAYLNTSLPLDARVKDLVSRLTLKEKVDQLMYTAPAIPRLNIPAYNWWNEALHGVARSGPATVFPQAIGLAATFDDQLALKESSAISDEARAMFNAFQKNKNYAQYAGLTFWTPNINIFRDPRWGRGQETYGEDPFLTSKMGVAFVKGLQGDNPKYLKTAACAKHFAVHSGPEKLRHEFDVNVSKKDLWETYLPAFHSLVNAGVAGVMCAYNSVDGEPCCANTYLLQDVLRNQWKFKGYITSDCWALVDIYQGHKFVPTATEAAAVALKRGVDLNCGSTFPSLVDAVKQGLVTEKEIDSALSVLMKIRFRLGLFDPQNANPYNRIPDSVVNSAAHRNLARKVAEESFVLLKNDGVLPLKNNLHKYYVTGPNAAVIEPLIGNYYGVNKNMVTVLEGITGHVQPGSQVTYRQGTLLSRENVNKADWASGEAKVSDATIYVMGISDLIEGEEGESIASSTSGDRLNYDLPQNQIDYLKKLKSGNKNPVIAVVTGGSPMNLSEVQQIADAVLLVWYPGEEGGNAVADVIFGKVSPSGKLPLTFPKSFDDLPPFNDYSMNGRTYRYMKAEPMYPFGFGLSYTAFNYSNLKLSKTNVEKNQAVDAEVTVTNSGKVASDEVVQMYLTHLPGGDNIPLYSLKGFKRIHLAAGASQKVKFTITPDMMKLVNEDGQSVLNSGEIKVSIAGSLPSARSEELGAAKPVEASFTVK
ncbi:MAG TPA: glycoside hydrolase family 3 C-terminal domain-containing protein [Hanamia sp.]|nr:glycoside hydrolase family 3 C-terminal domain-containing protein [Hanamia sp.]